MYIICVLVLQDFPQIHASLASASAMHYLCRSFLKSLKYVVFYIIFLHVSIEIVVKTPPSSVKYDSSFSNRSDIPFLEAHQWETPVRSHLPFIGIWVDPETKLALVLKNHALASHGTIMTVDEPKFLYSNLEFQISADYAWKLPLYAFPVNNPQTLMQENEEFFLPKTRLIINVKFNATVQISLFALLLGDNVSKRPTQFSYQAGDGNWTNHYVPAVGQKFFFQVNKKFPKTTSSVTCKFKNTDSKAKSMALRRLAVYGTL
ncbi:uncharacterized protein LOC132192680 [Neocloeon triangulifer]|uniref:uncharacterized protein LOC132192680 n=1 Tax=Neocloeon triangulifer TaxID=2078957 RepID=UPI00286FA4F2|nr:uncharacterized protein LOC132192680 [Neocloeon triangulifer]